MASDYNSAQAFKVARHFEFKNGVNIETLAALKTLTYKDSMIQILDTDAAYDINLPAERNGTIFFIKNENVTHSFTVKNDAGATIATVAAGEGSLFACDGTDWKLVIKA